MALGYELGYRGFESRQRLGIFRYTTASRTALGPTYPHIQWVSGAVSLGVKRPGREADHSPPSSAEVKNAWSYTSTPQHTFMAWCSFKKKRKAYRDNFTFTFIENCILISLILFIQCIDLKWNRFVFINYLF
jgi:hypothetical protein